LSWETDAGEKFTDELYETARALSRLALVASRVCGRDADLPDDDDQAAKELTDMIMESVIGRRARCQIQDYKETYTPRNGPNAGIAMLVPKKKVAFAGYEPCEGQTAAPAADPEPATVTAGDTDPREAAETAASGDSLPF
jgi:hypothetical protein